MSEPPEAPPEIRLVELSKDFRDVRAVDHVSLDIRPGEFFSLLGPSGCGKTTTLRMIGGFELPSRGRIELRGVDVTTAAPDKRPVNMVFQHYALFPHLDVAENIAFGLRRRHVGRDEIARRVGEALELVRLPGYERRRPNQLSGGQQQRVALARALVNRPTVLLLDEPLGALDLKLRRQLQVELKRIQTEVGITFVYVTHDQEEALTMSDRLAVMDRGRIEQLGTPTDVYERPATEFVAGFIGVSNLLERDGRRITVRPEKVHLLAAGEEAPPDSQVEDGTITDVVYLGVVTRYVVTLDVGGDLVAVRQNLETAAADAFESRGQRVRVAWRHSQAYEIATESPSEKER